MNACHGNTVLTTFKPPKEYFNHIPVNMISLLSSLMYRSRSLARTLLYSNTAAYLFPKCLLAPALQGPTRFSGHCWRKNRDTPIFFSCTRLTNSSASAVAAADSSNAHTNDGSMLNKGAKRMEEPIHSSDTLFEHHQITSLHGRKFPLWISRDLGRNIDTRKKIFCNRSLNMKSIVAIGFDMDYTLAQYRPDTFETLAYNGTLKKLVYNLGYPKELLQWKFDWKYMVRGLVLDKKRGNILKMDRHKYVKVAYHGFKEMLREDRFATYGNTLLQESFDEPDYALIDTLFSLAEAYLFAQLVELKDAHPEKLPAGTEYEL